MLNFKRSAPMAIAAFALIAVSSLAAAAPTGGAADYGVRTAPDNYSRQIVITPDTRTVNVSSGETVQFEIGGKTYGWHFDIYGGEKAVDLSKILPAGAEAPHVKIYIEADPLYLG